MNQGLNFERPPTPTFRLPSQSPPIVVSPKRQSTLPPISSQKSDVNEEATTVLLHQSKGEVEDVMKYLLSEAQSAEGRIQRSIDALWQHMLDHIQRHSQEMEQKYSHVQSELEETKLKVIRLTNQEAALVQKNAKTCMQFSAEEKKRIEAEKKVADLLQSLSISESSFRELTLKSKDKEKLLMGDHSKLQLQIDEKEAMLREYQSKISKLTDKMNRLAKDLSSEKAATEKHQKSISDIVSQHTSENRKLLVELSKLKGQLSSTSSTLTNVKEENKKLELQLKSQQQDHELTLTRVNKEHTKTVQGLEHQISTLQKELEQLKSRYISETESLKQQIVNAHKALAEIAAGKGEDSGDDYIEARIKFLQHQNRQEKVKLLHKQPPRR